MNRTVGKATKPPFKTAPRALSNSNFLSLFLFIYIITLLNRHRIPPLTTSKASTTTKNPRATIWACENSSPQRTGL
ncbi:hypothetical protein Hanom_Chr13g01242461 [Helianthus anomalus]